MGNRRRHKEEFLKIYPLCCFCGGKNEAVEIDHVPGRVFFRNRQWPEGYEFPACTECNRATRFEEKVIALLARFNSPENNEVDNNEFESMLKEISVHDPDFFHDIRPLDANEIRRFLREHNIEKPSEVSTFDIPIVGIGKVVNKSVRKFGKKLCLALWFKHTGKIFPRLGGMRLRWFSNVSHNIDNEAWNTMIKMLPSIPNITKNSHHLHDQFTYRYVITQSGDGAGFFVWFRHSFGILCTLAIDKKLIQAEANEIESVF